MELAVLLAQRVVPGSLRQKEETAHRPQQEDDGRARRLGLSRPVLRNVGLVRAGHDSLSAECRTELRANEGGDSTGSGGTVKAENWSNRELRPLRLPQVGQWGPPRKRPGSTSHRAVLSRWGWMTLTATRWPASRPAGPSREFSDHTGPLGRSYRAASRLRSVDHQSPYVARMAALNSSDLPGAMLSVCHVSPAKCRASWTICPAW